MNDRYACMRQFSLTLPTPLTCLAHASRSDSSRESLSPRRVLQCDGQDLLQSLQIGDFDQSMDESMQWKIYWMLLDLKCGGWQVSVTINGLNIDEILHTFHGFASKFWNCCNSTHAAEIFWMQIEFEAKIKLIDRENWMDWYLPAESSRLLLIFFLCSNGLWLGSGAHLQMVLALGKLVDFDK